LLIKRKRNKDEIAKKYPQWWGFGNG